VSESKAAPVVVYLLTDQRNGVNSPPLSLSLSFSLSLFLLHRLLNYYIRFMASVESMGRRVRPRRYARRRLDFQLAAYRLLVFDICLGSFVKLIEAPKCFGGMYGLFFRRMEISGRIVSHTFVGCRGCCAAACAEYINRHINGISQFFRSAHAGVRPRL